MFKIGDLVTCTRRGKYTYTTKDVICEVIEIYEDYDDDIKVKIIDTNSVIATHHKDEFWTVNSKYFALINTKKNNIDEWR